MPTFRFPRINSGSKVHVFMNDSETSASVTALQKCIPDSDVTQCTTSSSASDNSDRPTPGGSLLYLSDDDDDDSGDHTKSHTDTVASPFLYGTQHLGDGDDASTTNQSLSKNGHPHHLEFITLPPPANLGRTVELIPTGSGRDEIKKSSSYSHIHRILDEKNAAAMLTATTASPFLPGPAHHHRVRSEVPKMTVNESDSFSTDEDESEEVLAKSVTKTVAALPRRPGHRRTGSEVLVRSASDYSSSNSRPNPLYSSSEGIKPALPSYNSPKISSGQSASKTLSQLHATLQMRLHRFGANHPQVAEMWNRLGNYFYRSRAYDQALECYLEAIRCCTCSNTGSSNSNEMDDTAGAIAAAAATSSLDQLATAHRNIGAVFWATGKADRAIPSLHKALDVYDSHTKAFTHNPPKNVRLAVASTWYQLGLALTLQQSYDSALDALWHAKSIREHSLSPTHIEVGRTIDAIGKVFFFQQNYDAALKCHQDALEVKRASAATSKKRMGASSGSSSPIHATSGVVTSLMNIAAVHQVRGEVTQAIQLYEQVLQMQMAVLAQGRSSSGHKSWLHVRAALEVGETLLLLSDLYYSKRSSVGTQFVVKAYRLCKEAKFVYREAGLDDDHPQMQMAIQRYHRQQEEYQIHPLRS